MILRDVAKGMKALSDQKIMHRDLKPANIFISERVFKIGDFGFARKTYGIKAAQTIVGTPMYMSPQLLLK
jgi:serine/threonine protein kinase